MSHTKGEWKIKVGNYPNSYFLESIVQESETEANVKLIEAAPVMLKALESELAAWNEIGKRLPAEDDNDYDPGAIVMMIEDVMARQRKVISAAIQKAK